MYFFELTLLLATILIQRECFAGDGSLELNDGPNTVNEYYVKDQCMAQPGYFHLHHFSLAFYLKEYQICEAGPDGMDGLLICYRSQLEKAELLPLGMQPSRQFELRNVAGNEVAKQCQEVGGPNWHGILINKNEKRNWVLRFSTTNRTFIIEEEKLEELIYKLASAKDVGESFLSKTFGPNRDFMNWNNDHFGKAEEADNRIRHVSNEKLKALFMERQAMQERLQNYAGIWSLGLDMLPSKDGIDHFELIVRKSECCQNIKAFFNQPTAQLLNPEMPQIKDEKIEEPASIFENFAVTLDGIFEPDANNFIFEIVDQFVPEDKSQGIGFIVNFENNSIIFQQKINENWTDIVEMPKIPNHFARGMPFHLVIILDKNGMRMNVNCNGSKRINLNKGIEIVFENPHLINITGDYKYWNFNFSNTIASLKSWMIEGDGFSRKNKSAIMFRGKINDNAKNFSIKLWSRQDNGSYNCLFELGVDVEQKLYKLNGALEINITHSYNAGSEFKAVIEFSNSPGSVNVVWICMEDKKVGDVNIGADNIHFVEIVGDATAHMEIISNDSAECFPKGTN